MHARWWNKLNAHCDVEKQRIKTSYQSLRYEDGVNGSKIENIIILPNAETC